MKKYSWELIWGGGVILLLVLYLPYQLKANRLKATNILRQQKFQSFRITGNKLFHWCGKSTGAYHFTAVKNDKPIKGYVCNGNLFRKPRVVIEK